MPDPVSATEDEPTASTEPRASFDESERLHRLEKLDALRARGIEPYPVRFDRDATAQQLRDEYGSLEPDQTTGRTVRLAGRIVGERRHGSLDFADLRDQTGQIQLLADREHLGAEALADFANLDLGDWVGVEGTVMTTRTGELSVALTSFQLLSKALRPLPDLRHGLTDPETRYRQRYLDLATDPQVRENFRKRTELVRYIRRFLDDRDFLEVETPMLHPLVSGAAARPFETHHNALDIDLYLRIAPELYLKRLVVGGFERVYEINRNFRNEGLSTRHNPEFTMLEFYLAHATFDDLMRLTEEMIAGAAQAVCGTTRITYQGHEIDFGPGWKRITMADAVLEATGGQLAQADLEDPDKLRAVLLKNFRGTDAERKAIDLMGIGELVGALFEEHCEHAIVHPTFVTKFPAEISPLARRNDQDPRVTDRFELYCAGREIVNAFSELNDPQAQQRIFERQVELKSRGAQETMDFDADYIAALEHGMPPTAGLGMGIDRLAMLLTDSASIRDVILFPLLKPR